MTFLEETLHAIEGSGHVIQDIIFIGSEESGHQCEWSEFETLANFDYNNGYGAAHVATDLIVVFSDGAKLWRGEYDGSEWWEYSTPFLKPEEKHSISTLSRNGMWDSLSDLNG